MRLFRGNNALGSEPVERFLNWYQPLQACNAAPAGRQVELTLGKAYAYASFCDPEIKCCRYLPSAAISSAVHGGYRPEREVAYAVEQAKHAVCHFARFLCGFELVKFTQIATGYKASLAAL